MNQSRHHAKIKPPNSRSASILEISQIKKNFGYCPILRGVSFKLQKGRQTLLLGKNGAGKSTLFKILSGLMRPTSGQISLHQKEISLHPRQLRQMIGVISHASQVYKELSAQENLAFYSQLREVENRQEKIEVALKKTGLSDFSSIPVKCFSSGMLKRLNIAKLLVAKPKILLLDEPYTGLDYDSINLFNDFLRQFKTEGGTILLISHQIETCFDNSDDILILESGIIKNQYLRSDFSYQDLIQKYQSITT